MKHVLVVDDSAVVRTALAAILATQKDLTTATAADAVIAARKMTVQRPDVMVLDLEMPHIDGLTFLRSIMATDPLPVVICSGNAARDSDLGIRALEEGAVSIITKPKLGVRDFVEESARVIIDTIRDAASAHVHKRTPLLTPVPRLSADSVIPAKAAPVGLTTEKVVALAASTGGTEALREVLQAMPPDCPAMVIVQHMPAVFSAAFARRLNSICRIEVKEAASGDRLLPGRALIAPGDRHTLVHRNGVHYVIEVRDAPPVSRHRPSADVLFRSVAQAAGSNAVGIIMTGMGDDGASGLLEMRQSGAATIAQDEATCVVFGMPKEAIERGGVEQVLPLPRLADALLRAVGPSGRGAQNRIV